ncbi:hypothetical protein IKZ40_07435 [bacterium]|nr:hypothetical protein [bacterium]
MSEIWRAKNDTKNWSPSCIATILLFAATSLAFFMGLSAYFTERSGDLFKAAYPLLEPLLEDSVTDNEKAGFSNAFFRIAQSVNEHPLILTNKEMLLVRDMVMDQRISREEIGKIEALAAKVSACHE